MVYAKETPFNSTQNNFYHFRNSLVTSVRNPYCTVFRNGNKNPPGNFHSPIPFPILPLSLSISRSTIHICEFKRRIPHSKFSGPWNWNATDLASMMKGNGLLILQLENLLKILVPEDVGYPQHIAGSVTATLIGSY